MPTEFRHRLTPHTTSRLTDGRPDLLGVGVPDAEVVNADVATALIT